MAGNQGIVVEHRKELSYLLCQAAEIEHMAMCQYLYAAFSLRTSPGPGLTPAQLEVVERWRTQILRIAAEEMLHWALVNNLLTAIGSAPFVSRPNLPHRAKGYPPSVQFALLGFGEAALRHFVYFERPQDVDVAEVPEFAPEGPAPAPMRPDELQPRTQDFVSQGELYRALDEGLEYLAEQLGEDGLFIGPQRAQAGPSSFGWDALVPVTDLASAKTALVRIIEQGEGGTSHDVEKAHYGRFLAILNEYLALCEADPSFEPAHPVSAATVRLVEDDEPSGPLISDPTTAAVSDLFNVVNDLVLQVLSRYFAFGTETEAQLAVLTDVAVTLMFEAIKPLGLLLAELPVGDDHPGLTAGANFQLAYRSNFLLPHQRVAWLRFAERLEQTADFADAITAAPTHRGVLASVGASLRACAGRLIARVDSESALDQPVPAVARSTEPVRIEVEASGPYRVFGSVPVRRLREVRSAAGEPMTWLVTERLETGSPVVLCRCGGSASKPFCDNSHRLRDWDGTENAPTSSYAERAVVVPGGAGTTVRDDRSICSGAGFCATKLSNVWKMVGDLQADDTVTRAYVMAMIERCPSGALTYSPDPDGDAIEPEVGMAVGIVEHGPLLITGGVTVARSDGAPFERRNRVVLCRCGQSAIKPLCDGSHSKAGFRDPREPS